MPMFLEMFKEFKKPIIVSFSLIVLGMCIEVLTPILFGKVVTSVSNTEWNNAFLFVGIGFLCFMAQEAVLWIREFYELRNLHWKVFGVTMVKSLRKMLSLSIGQHVHEHSGKMYSILSKGESSIVEMINLFVYQVIPTAIKILIYLIALAIVFPPLALVSFVGLVLFSILTIRSNAISMPGLRKLRKSFTDIEQVRQESLRIVPTITLNSRTEQSGREMGEKVDSHLHKVQNHWSGYYRSSITRFTLITVCRYFNMALGVFFVSKGQIDVGTFVGSLYLSNVVLGDIGSFGHFQRMYLMNSPHVAKYLNLFSIEPLVKNRSSAVALKHVKGDITVTDVTFSYLPQDFIDTEDEEDESTVSLPIKKPEVVLTDISLHIEGGARVAFVGHSGSGKTTLARLLVRAYDPQAGEIRLDNHDLRDVTLDSLHGAIGFVEQNVTLTSGTMRENITFGLNGNASAISDSELDTIARLCRIDQFKGRMSSGWDTKVGEDGIQLSGGERQRVGIARALIRKPKILIFDEATSNLDRPNEKAIQETIDSIHGVTTVIIAHRLSTVRKCDTIFVFKKGRIVAQGTHEVLMKRSPDYQELVGSDEFLA